MFLTEWWDPVAGGIRLLVGSGCWWDPVAGGIRSVLASGLPADI